MNVNPEKFALAVVASSSSNLSLKENLNYMKRLLNLLKNKTKSLMTKQFKKSRIS